MKTRGEGKGKAKACEPEPWKMHRCEVVHPGSGEVLDDGLAVFFKGESPLRALGFAELNCWIARSEIVHYRGCARTACTLGARYHILSAECHLVIPILPPR